MLSLMRSAVTGIVVVLGAGLATSAAAQLPVDQLRLVVGFGVDTTASPEREILSLWKHYLTTPSDSLRATLWSSRERSAGPHFDLVGPYVYQGFTHFTVVHLGPAVGLRETFVVRTLVTAVDDSTTTCDPSPSTASTASRSGSDQGNYLSLFEKINKTEPFKGLEDHF